MPDLVRPKAVAMLFAGAWLAAAAAAAQTGPAQPEFHDAHFHLTNYVQRGITLSEFLATVGNRRRAYAVVFGIPLQQKWDYFESGDRAPDYYLHSDAALYYYSFVDAIIAEQYQSLLAGRAGTLRSDDHGLQPDRHVRRWTTSDGCWRCTQASSRGSASSRSTRSS